MLRPDAVVLQRIFPEIGELLGAVAAARFELFEAVTCLFRCAAERQPLVLVVEGLHWADQATYLLFGHLAAELNTSPILLIGSYRNGELSGNESLSALVAELNRETGFESVTLQGLHRDDVNRYFDEVGGPRASSRLGTDAHELIAFTTFPYVDDPMTAQFLQAVPASAPPPLPVPGITGSAGLVADDGGGPGATGLFAMLAATAASIAGATRFVRRRG